MQLSEDDWPLRQGHWRRRYRRKHPRRRTVGSLDRSATALAGSQSPRVPQGRRPRLQLNRAVRCQVPDLSPRLLSSCDRGPVSLDASFGVVATTCDLRRSVLAGASLKALAGRGPGQSLGEVPKPLPALADGSSIEHPSPKLCSASLLQRSLRLTGAQTRYPNQLAKPSVPALRAIPLQVTATLCPDTP